MKALFENVEKNIEYIPEVIIGIVRTILFVACAMCLASITIVMSGAERGPMDFLHNARGLYHMAYVVAAEGIALLLFYTLIKKRFSGDGRV